MPPLASPGKVVRCDLFFTYGPNTRVRDRIFFSYTAAGPPTVTDLNTLATTISAAWNTNMVPQTNTSLTLTGITLTDLSSATGAQVVTTQSRVGTLAGVAVPDATAMVIKFKIARRYRGGHPRFYLPGRVNADLASLNSWLSSVGGTVSISFASFITACTTAPPANLVGLAHVNISYFSGFLPVRFPSGRYRNIPQPKTPPGVDAITGYSVNLLVGSQRRRNQQSA